MKSLASLAMAVFCVQRLLPAQLVLDSTAMTTPFVTNFEIFCVAVNGVGCSMLPLVKTADSILALLGLLFRRHSCCYVAVRSGRHASKTGAEVR